MTRSGNLPVHHPYYESATVIYLTSDHEVPVHEPTVEICRVDTLVDVLGDLARRGAGRILCEGGPTLNAGLFEAQLIDDVFLTIAPKIVGGSNPLTIVQGPQFAETIHLVLRSLVELEGELFLHYRVEYPSSQT